jgi:hypothetical protein
MHWSELRLDDGGERSSAPLTILTGTLGKEMNGERKQASRRRTALRS